MASLILDEQIGSSRIVQALRDRGIDARTIKELGAQGRPDPEVIHRIVQPLDETTAWVLVTMDLTIVEDFPGFDWQRYAIGWVVLRPGVRGVAVEIEKTEVVQRHAHDMREQTPGDHFTYTVKRRYQSRPSLTTLMRRA